MPLRQASPPTLPCSSAAGARLSQAQAFLRLLSTRMGGREAQGGRGPAEQGGNAASLQPAVTAFCELVDRLLVAEQAPTPRQLQQLERRCQQAADEAKQPGAAMTCRELASAALVAASCSKRLKYSPAQLCTALVTAALSSPLLRTAQLPQWQALLYGLAGAGATGQGMHELCQLALASLPLSAWTADGVYAKHVALLAYAFAKVQFSGDCTLS